jgi:transposase-like protein
MNEGKPVILQMQSLISRFHFEKFTKKYNADKNFKTFFNLESVASNVFNVLKCKACEIYAQVSPAMPISEWGSAMNQFAVYFGDRVPL